MEDKNNTQKYNLYDSIIQNGVKWICGCTESYGGNYTYVGINNFNRKDKTHCWLLNLLKVYKYFTVQHIIFVKTSLINYLWIRYIKKFRYFKKIHKATDNILLIDPYLFAKELCEAHNVDPSIVEEIYQEYCG